MPFSGVRIRLLGGTIVALALVGIGLLSHAALPARASAHLHRTADALSRGADAAATTAGPATKTAPDTHWITAWGAATQGPNPGAPMSEQGFNKRTLREVVYLTSGGDQLRIRFSNVYGSKPLHIGSASVAVQRQGAWTAPGTLRQLRFYKKPGVIVQPGHQALSDPVRLTVKALTRLEVSLYLSRPTGPTTQQIDSRETSYAAGGSHALQSSGRSFTQQLQDWYFLSAVVTHSPRRDMGSLVALGDSITAGVGSSRGANATWPDDLARRLAKLTGTSLSVVDMGIGGNRVLNDSPCCGISAMARFEPNVVRTVGVRTVVLLEGVNDLGFSQKTDSLSAPHTDVSADQIIAGYRQIIAQAHRHGLRIIGATLTPYKGARYWNATGEKKRDQINSWILTSHAFNGVIDFASVLGEPGNPQQLNPAYDSGDHLHPNNAGYRAMADSIQLGVLFPR